MVLDTRSRSMCGRFTLRTPARDLVKIFELLREPELSPRYNIAPTQNVAVIRARRQESIELWHVWPLHAPNTSS
jgi:putative SOS response-associated peptidase YedK